MERRKPIIGITFGAFDLLHTGHLLFLHECKKQCDILVVGLQTDPTIDRKEKNKPIQSIYERFTQLIKAQDVSSIVPYDTEADLINILAASEIDVRFLGSDYRSLPITGEELCNEKGIELIFIDRLHNYSTSELRDRVFENELKKRTN